MPLPQQDEFGVKRMFNEEVVQIVSQCRFRSKMNSECFSGQTSREIETKSQCRFRSKMNSESINKLLYLMKKQEVSMPLPQQDEFGEN